MDTKIKLCGLMDMDDIGYANELCPDYVGFVFAKGSKRKVDLDKAKEMKELLSPKIGAVGVFKDNSTKEILNVVETGVISAIQLHGHETEELVKEIKCKTNLTVIRAFGILGESDIKKANESFGDYVLLDAPGGGTGNIFNHDYITGVNRRFFLAGGLDSENVKDFIRKYKPYAVDVSSGIESGGKKDYKKMKEFVEAVRSV